jgi:Recombinase
VADKAEATTVREIVEAYLQGGSVAALQAELNCRGIVGKRWASSARRTYNVPGK